MIDMMAREGFEWLWGLKWRGGFFFFFCMGACEFGRVTPDFREFDPL